MKRKSVVAALALIAGVVASTSAFVLPAHAAGVLILDVTGVGSGVFNSNPFTAQSFDIHLVGQENNQPFIDPVTRASIRLGLSGPFDFTGGTRVGLNFTPDFSAFFGLSSGPTDLVHLTVSPSDFAGLQNINGVFGPVPAALVFLNFSNIGTSGGLLT